jgi:hypothetical protein
MSGFQRAGLCASIALAVLLTCALGATAATASEPANARQLSTVLAAKKLGCRDFAPAQTGAPSSTRPNGSTTTLPLALQAVVALVGDASVGTCTVNGKQTVLVVFPDSAARQTFETALAGLPCGVLHAVLGGLAPNTTSAQPAVKVPLAELGARGVVFSTGAAPNTDRLDLAAAAAADRAIAKKARGAVRTFTYECSS